VNYQDFLASKQTKVQPVGFDVAASAINPMLFPFQNDLTRWAARKGRAALFADTGLGKTMMQLEWSRLLGERTLILAPLGVALQTVREATRLGASVHYTRGGDDLSGGINITNYEMLSRFDASRFGAVVLDESSILKALDGKTRARLTEMFAGTPYRLCCTATPAPNDIAEIANHAEFLGVMTRVEMLATFFVHDDEGWRLKGHAQDAFYEWLASWAMSIRKPSDINPAYSDEGYNLPPLDIKPMFIESGYVPEGQLVFTGLKGITERHKVRAHTLEARCEAAAALVNVSSEQWIVWHGLNPEGYRLIELIPGAVLVEGSQSPEQKSAAFEAFQAGEIRVLVTKPKIAGFGMNFQNAHNMAFVGLSDSWEAYYQCIRRCYRFGQTQAVDVHIVLSDAEEAIYQNVMAKEEEARTMSARLIENVQQFEQAEILGAQASEYEYQTADISGKAWRLLLGDSAERMAELASESVDLSVFSPPFASLFTYSPTERDLGNSRNEAQFFDHFAFIIRELLRVTKPGRNACVHVADIPAMLSRDGFIGLKDFSGAVVEAFLAEGWTYHGRVTIDKDPQAQAIRTKAKALLFVQLHKDSSWSRPALADYILIFRKPGENAVPIQPDLTNDEWIEWARPVWYGIKESDTLNYAEAREEQDERHICPLQLGTIERCVRLWSNRGETVLSPFAGIGSEGYASVKQGRRFVGVELKPSYFNTAVRNLQGVEEDKHQMTLPGMDDLGAQSTCEAA
jgi:DNA modification methylase